MLHNKNVRFKVNVLSDSGDLICSFLKEQYYYNNNTNELVTSLGKRIREACACAGHVLGEAIKFEDRGKPPLEKVVITEDSDFALIAKMQSAERFDYNLQSYQFFELYVALLSEEKGRIKTSSSSRNETTRPGCNEIHDKCPFECQHLLETSDKESGKLVDVSHECFAAKMLVAIENLSKKTEHLTNEISKISLSVSDPGIITSLSSEAKKIEETLKMGVRCLTSATEALDKLTQVKSWSEQSSKSTVTGSEEKLKLQSPEDGGVTPDKDFELV